MWVHVLRVSIAATMWVFAIATMVMRSVGGPQALTGWAVLMGLGAAVFTGWHLLVLERFRVEQIAQLAAAATLDDRPLEPVR